MARAQPSYSYFPHVQALGPHPGMRNIRDMEPPGQVACPLHPAMLCSLRAAPERGGSCAVLLWMLGHRSKPIHALSRRCRVIHGPWVSRDQGNRTFLQQASGPLSRPWLIPHGLQAGGVPNPSFSSP